MKNKFYFIDSKTSIKELSVLFEKEKFYKCRLFYIDNSGKIKCYRYSSFKNLKKDF